VTEEFKEDGRIHRYIRATIDAAVKTMKSIRGHDPDAAYEQENAAYERGRRAGRREATTNNNGGGEESNWKTIALWALGALQGICIVIMSYIYGSLNDLRLSQSQTHDDVTQIKCKLDPACRIVVSGEQR
jgi:hypothetical protein